MKFFAINGSHRKDGNTAQLLEKALEGIKSVCSDAEIESVNLYDVPFMAAKAVLHVKRLMVVIMENVFIKMTLNQSWKKLFRQTV